MSEKRPRFPCVAALLCAACLGAAAWTWMRYSYAWDVGVNRLRHECLHGVDGGSPYYRVEAVFEASANNPEYPDEPLDMDLRSRTGERDSLNVVFAAGKRPAEGTRVVLRGRVSRSPYSVAFHVFDTTASRFHGASVSGLAVGAMGVFVFTVALRHWLREPRTGG